MLNRINRHNTFQGGYRFKGFSGQAEEKLIASEIPTRVLIPLSQGFGLTVKPLVKPGDTIRAGQIIGQDDESISSPVHSSINGKVVRLEKINYFNREIPMVEIQGDGSEDYEKITGYAQEWEKLPSEKIEELLYTSGVTSLDRQGIPTRFRTSVISPEEVEDLVIHWAGSEVYNLSLELLMKGKNLFDFVQGIKILKKIMPWVRFHLALNRKKNAIIERIQKLTSDISEFTIYPVDAKYPQGYDEVLISTLLNKEFPYGYSAANIGVIVLNMQAVLHVYEAVVEGKPLIERIIALCGPCFKENIHIRVRVGSPLEFILRPRIKDVPSRIVLNSLLTGFELKNLSLPIDRTFSQVIAVPENKNGEFFAFARPGIRKHSYSRAFVASYLPIQKRAETNLHGEERPCIQCGYCREVCPVRIFPSLIDRQLKLGISERLIRYGIFNCIDCNLCSYVCPAKIPLAANLRDARKKLTEMGSDKSMCILPRFDLKGLEDYKGVKRIR